LLFDKLAWDAAEAKELRDVLPGYNYDYDDEWDGWEAREVVFECEQAIHRHDDENYTAVLQVAVGLAYCEITFIFVSSAPLGFKMSAPSECRSFSQTCPTTTTST